MLMHSLTNLPSSMHDKTALLIPTRYIVDDVAEPVGFTLRTVYKSLCNSNFPLTSSPPEGEIFLSSP